MLGNILVPFDGSALAERAFPYATALARAGGARLILLHVRTGTEGADLPTADLHATADTLRDGGLTVEPDVYKAARGDVGQAISRAALSWQARLIVMSTHGRGGLGRWLYGSVADEVLRTAEIPVLLVPAASTISWPADRALRVLVPLDGSETAEAALGPATSLARSLQAELHLLRVVEVIDAVYPAYGSVVAMLPIDVPAELAEARRYLEGINGGLRADGIAATVHTGTGHPSATIDLVAREQGVDLIAMATHGRGGLARLVLGSVAGGTIERASVPLLLVRPAAPRPPAELKTTATTVELLPEVNSMAVVLTLGPRELDLLHRGLGELLYTPGRDARLAEPARALMARLKQAEPTSAPASVTVR